MDSSTLSVKQRDTSEFIGTASMFMPSPLLPGIILHTYVPVYS